MLGARVPKFRGLVIRMTNSRQLSYVGQFNRQLPEYSANQNVGGKGASLFCHSEGTEESLWARRRLDPGILLLIVIPRSSRNDKAHVALYTWSYYVGTALSEA